MFYIGLKLLTATEALKTKPVNPQDDWGLVFATVVTGIIVVFIILILLIFILVLMGKLIAKGDKTTEVIAEKKESEAVAVRTVDFMKEQVTGGEHEIIAVISAAIAAISENEGKNYNITNIKKKEPAVRSNWAKAGISESMNSFVR